MKKAIQIIGMMCMAAVMVMGASSCNKDKDKSVSSFDITLPAIEGESGFEDEKAYIDLVDNNKMKWYASDQVMMFSIDDDYTNSLTGVFRGEADITGTTRAHFAGGSMPVGSIGFFAFYPASKASTVITENNRATFNVGDTQTWETDLFAGTSYAGRIYMDPRCVVGAATCEVISPYANFTLQHIFGYVNVKVKDSGVSDRRLKSITITDSQKHLTGSMSIEIPTLTMGHLNAMKTAAQNYKANGDGDAYLGEITPRLQQFGYMGNGTGYSVTLDCSAANDGFGAQITNKNKYFLISLRPGALMDGFTITMKFFDEAGDVVVDVPADKKYITIPGTFTPISIDLKTGLIG